ncbi:MAG: hypothetical protein LBU65_15575, partial [Planctomycetaceae bacterium]|nr:hypothetical protein [Planctomycetaceae bacterium]
YKILNPLMRIVAANPMAAEKRTLPESNSLIYSQSFRRIDNDGRSDDAASLVKQKFASSCFGIKSARTSS